MTGVWRREEHKQEQWQQREAVIAEFDTGDTEATLHAIAAEILPPAPRVCPLPLLTDIAVPVGWTALGQYPKKALLSGTVTVSSPLSGACDRLSAPTA